MHKFLAEVMQSRYLYITANVDWQSQIAGAIGSGGHQINNANPIFEREGLEPVRMIILREPLERFLSFYKHVQDNPRHYLAGRPGVLGMSPLQFAHHCVETDVTEFKNLQARYVVGSERSYSDFSELTRIFDDEFSFFAPLKNINNLFDKINNFFGTDVSYPRKENVSTKRAFDSSDWQEMAEIVYAANAADVRLYSHCLERCIL